MPIWTSINFHLLGRAEQTETACDEVIPDLAVQECNCPNRLHGALMQRVCNVFGKPSRCKVTTSDTWTSTGRSGACKLQAGTACSAALSARLSPTPDFPHPQGAHSLSSHWRTSLRHRQQSRLTPRHIRCSLCRIRFPPHKRGVSKHITSPDQPQTLASTDATRAPTASSVSNHKTARRRRMHCMLSHSALHKHMLHCTRSTAAVPHGTYEADGVSTPAHTDKREPTSCKKALHVNAQVLCVAQCGRTATIRSHNICCAEPAHNNPGRCHAAGGVRLNTTRS